MAWRMAKSLEVLLGEINRRSPSRSTLSDGGIGDAAHQSRDSDHNPWVKDGSVGVVTARDFTNDPGDGFDSSEFAEWLRKRAKSGAESRVKYIISDRRICSDSFPEAHARRGRRNWEWWPYTGSNPHEKHVHVSVRSSKSVYDNEKSWGWATSSPTTPAPEKEDHVELSDPVKYTPSAKARLNKDADILSTVIQWPPAVRLARDEISVFRRETTAQLGALNATVGQLVTAIKGGSTLTAAQVTAAAQAGAQAALAQLGDALDGPE